MSPQIIDDIAANVRITPSEFSKFFSRVQEVMQVGNPISFEALARTGEDLADFKAALLHALANGWLNNLLSMIVFSSNDTAGLLKYIQHNPAFNASPLEAITNAAKGFLEPDIVMRGIIRAMKATGKIYIKKKTKGTCLLISPNLVITAWHVVRELFDEEGNALPESYKDLEFEFDDVYLYSSRGSLPRNGIRYKAHPVWDIVHNDCHNLELKNELPEDLQQLEGRLDYAVIRLEKVVGSDRTYQSMDQVSDVPQPLDNIILFQHAQGFSLQFDANVIAGEASAAIIGDYRFLHYSNTTHGSSGGPCFDRDFKFFGIHQGKWETRIHDFKVVNRGIPIRKIKADYEEKIQRLPSPDPEDFNIWQLDEAQGYHPVIGRDDLQSKVWASIAEGEKRIFNFIGGKGSGKTFCTTLLAYMLPPDAHLILDFDAGMLARKNALSTANLICHKAGSTGLKTGNINAMDSTSSVWIKSQLVPALVEELDKARKERLVWIILKELNKSAIKGLRTGELLFSLCESVNQLSWLRIVVDGLPEELPLVVRRREERYICSIEQGHIQDYFIRAFSFLELLDVEKNAVANARRLKKEYDRHVRDNMSNAVELLAKAAQETVLDYTIDN